MPDCFHVQLLRVTEAEHGPTVHYGGRFRNIASELPRPFSQYPSIVTFTSNKRNPLRTIYPESRLSFHRHHGLANIALDLKTVNNDHPVIIADCSLVKAERRLSQTSNHKCHESVSLPIQWPPNTAPSRGADLATFVQVRLLFLFTDVICIFGEDYDGLPGTAAKLASWAAIGSSSTLPRRTRPRLVVAYRENVEASHYRSELLAIRGFSECFSSLAVVKIEGTTRLQPVKDTLDQEIQHARLARRETNTQFSAVHLAEFFGNALLNFSQVPHSKFDFVSSTRVYVPISHEFKHHLRAFMAQCIEHRVPQRVALSYVASALLMDSCPPGMHRK